MWKVRKFVTNVEEVLHDRGPDLSKPLRIGTAAVVVQNPYAGKYVEDLMPGMEALNALGRDVARRLLKALEAGPAEIEAYGKGAIVGADGELEHGAMWHPSGGWGMRAILGDTKAIVPAGKMVGPVGVRLMMPLGHVNAAYVRSHFHTVGVSIDDAPRADEIVYALGMATAGRPNARLGGLAAKDIKGEDGLH